MSLLAAVDGRHVALVGLMGTGKSTAGKAVAAHLHRAYVDNDDLLHAAAGRTAKEIQDDDGAEALHALELQVLREALARSEPAVIGAAASVVDTVAGRALLEEPFVVWLRANPAKLAVSVAKSKKQHRPLGDDVALTLRRQAATRDPWYATLADLVVNADHPHDVMAEEIIAHLS